MDINAKLIYSAAAAAVRLKRKTFKKDSSVKTILRIRAPLVCVMYIRNNEYSRLFTKLPHFQLKI